MRLPRAEALDWRTLDDQYVTATGSVEHQVSDVITWADANKITTPGVDHDAIRAARLSIALQSDVSRDHLGRLVRNRYCKEVSIPDDDGRPVQRTLWANWHQASDNFRRTSLLQRWQNIAHDVERLRADVDRTNDDLGTRGLPLIQTTFNFDAPASDEEAS